jgi:hypothetical protein
MSKPVVLIDAGELVGLSGSAEGDILQWNATTGEWYAAAGGGTGTVTSVTLSTASTGLTLAGGATSQTITGAGTFTLGGTLGAGYGGTGLGAPAPGDVGKVLTAKADGTYELGTPAPAGVTSVTASAPLASSGGTTPNLSLGTVGTAQTSLGSATKTLTISTDAYGRVTALSEQAISGLAASVISSGQLATAQGGTGIDASGATDGELLVGQSTGSFALHSMSQDATMANSGAVTVKGLQSRAVSSVAPTAGQTLVWSASGGGAWVPGSQAAGGSGGGGVLYYMNAGTAVSGGNLPANTYQLGRSAEASSHPITLTNVATGSWTRVGGFVTDAGDPALTNIPAGIWDFNIWASSTANANNMFFRLTLYAYDGSTNPESGPVLGTSVLAYLYDPSQAVQYITSFALAQTAFSSKRIYLKLEVQASTANKDVTFGFGDGEASHAHTTVPSVTGSGFVKVLNDVIVGTGQTVDLSSSTDVGASILGVANGGTGQSSLTNHGLVVGQGASAVASLLGTTAGDVVRWNGTSWASAALSSNAVTSLTGTTDQIDVSASTGSVTLSLPQSIASTNSPSFAGLTLSGLLDGLVRATSGVLAGGATVGGSDFGSQTANTVFAAPNGSAGNPSFRALVATDIPSLSSVYLPLSGGTLAGQLITTATATLAGLTVGSSVLAPTSLVNGDIWYQTNTNTLYARLNGASQAIVASNPSTNTSIAPASTSGSPGFSFSIFGGNSTAISGSGGALTFAAGSATGTTSTGGTLTLRAGSGTAANGAISIGATNTASIGIGAAGVTTTFSGRVVTPALTTSAAGFNISPTSATPTTLSNGDIWVTSANLFVRINGVTQTLAPLASPTFTGTPAAPTASSGDNTTQIATTAFVTTAVAASTGAPYDVSGEAAGTLANGDEIWHFKATRAFTLSATATNHLAGAVTAPSGTCVITVYKNNTSTQVFTITYTASATGVIGSVTNNAVAQGDLLFAKITSGPSTISNPYWTFFGTL